MSEIQLLTLKFIAWFVIPNCRFYVIILNYNLIKLATFKMYTTIKAKKMVFFLGRFSGFRCQGRYAGGEGIVGSE